MAEQAEALLAGSGWLPEPLRTPGSHAVDGERGQRDCGRDPKIRRQEPERDRRSRRGPPGRGPWPAAVE